MFKLILEKSGEKKVSAGELKTAFLMDLSEALFKIKNQGSNAGVASIKSPELIKNILRSKSIMENLDPDQANQIYQNYIAAITQKGAYPAGAYQFSLLKEKLTGEQIEQIALTRIEQGKQNPLRIINNYLDRLNPNQIEKLAKIIPVLTRFQLTDYDKINPETKQKEYLINKIGFSQKQKEELILKCADLTTDVTKKAIYVFSRSLESEPTEEEEIVVGFLNEKETIEEKLSFLRKMGSRQRDDLIIQNYPNLTNLPPEELLEFMMNNKRHFLYVLEAVGTTKKYNTNEQLFIYLDTFSSLGDFATATSSGAGLLSKIMTQKSMYDYITSREKQTRLGDLNFKAVEFAKEYFENITLSDFDISELFNLKGKNLTREEEVRALCQRFSSAFSENSNNNQDDMSQFLKFIIQNNLNLFVEIIKNLTEEEIGNVLKNNLNKIDLSSTHKFLLAVALPEEKSNLYQRKLILGREHEGLIFQEFHRDFEVDLKEEYKIELLRNLITTHSNMVKENPELTYMLKFDQVEKITKTIKDEKLRKEMIIYALKQPHLFKEYKEKNNINPDLKPSNLTAIAEIINMNRSDLLNTWHEKAGFIPHHTVMMTLPEEYIEKFNIHGKEWSQLMKIPRYNLNDETKTALLKMAVAFGVFDGDQKGMSTVKNLLTKFPRKIPDDVYQKLVDGATKEERNHLVDNSELPQKGNVIIVNPKQNEQSYFREFLEREATDLSILTPETAHMLFGRFKMEYNPEFRKFFLENINEILQDEEKIKLTAAIQRQFSEIKALNSNRALTLDVAIDFVKTNEYSEIGLGNESLAIEAKQNSYGQNDYDELQKIYEYTKTRVDSTIPRVSGEISGLSYEIVSLTSSIPLTVGAVTNCCQQLDDAAESCMIHSATDRNGRIFIVKDKEGSIVAQSWIWRNGNTACFDNIEIPKKAFAKLIKEKDFSSNAQVAEEILNIYKTAAKELIDLENKEYNKAKDTNKITAEEEKYKLTKVTVGMGYNDIKDALEANCEKVETTVRPLPFVSPIDKKGHLYTSDSSNQVVLEEKPEHKDVQGIPILSYPKETEIYDGFNIDQGKVNTFRRQEMLYNQTNEKYISGKPETFNEELSEFYETTPEKLKLIIEPFFSIVYTEEENENQINDILYNEELINEFSIAPEQTKEQFKMALEKLQAKQVNLEKLEENKLAIYNQATSAQLPQENEKAVAV